MSLIKFITVFDDEKQKLLYNDILSRYNISLYPPLYCSKDKHYIDYINADSALYKKHSGEDNEIIGPHIPVKVFQQAIKFAYDDGYTVVLIVCPSRKFFPHYYRNAQNAAKNFCRNKDVDLTTFRIKVIDSKAIGAGHLYLTLQLARLHNNDHCPSGIVIDDSKNFISKTLILSSSAEQFGFRKSELAAFRVFDGRLLTDLNVTESTDYVKFDMFAKACAKYIKNSKSKYLISVGADCTFAGNVIGRIEKLLNFPPIATIQYGINTTSILGTESFCLHIV